jgi:hypothetical protein
MEKPGISTFENRLGHERARRTRGRAKPVAKSLTQRPRFSAGYTQNGVGSASRKVYGQIFDFKHRLRFWSQE